MNSTKTFILDNDKDVISLKARKKAEKMFTSINISLFQTFVDPILSYLT
jgi:hypothetical protein